MRHFVLIAAFLFAGCLSAPASVDTGLLSLVPAEAKIVASVDVARARNSDFGQYLLSKAQTEDAHFQEMVAQTGFDPRRDLQVIMFAANGPGEFAILARGSFDVERIKALAASKGATVVSYRGLDMIVHAQENGQQTAIGFPEAGVAVMADLETLKGVIDNRTVRAPLDANLQSKIASIGGNDAWYVSLEGAGLPAPQARALQGIVQSSGGVKFGPAIETTFDAVTRSPQDAISLTGVIRFGASMATALDGMTLTTSGVAVHFAASLPEKRLEQLAEALPHVMARH